VNGPGDGAPVEDVGTGAFGEALGHVAGEGCRQREGGGLGGVVCLRGDGGVERGVGFGEGFAVAVKGEASGDVACGDDGADGELAGGEEVVVVVAAALADVGGDGEDLGVVVAAVVDEDAVGAVVGDGVDADEVPVAPVAVSAAGPWRNGARGRPHAVRTRDFEEIVHGVPELL
jgi:hypothetical protein